MAHTIRTLRMRFLVLVAAVFVVPLVGISGSTAAPEVVAGAFADSPAVAIAEVVSSGNRANYVVAAHQAGPGDDFEGTKVVVIKHPWDSGNPRYSEEVILPLEALTWDTWYDDYRDVTLPKLVLEATLPTMGDFHIQFSATCRKVALSCAQEFLSTIYVSEPSLWAIVSEDYASHARLKGTVNGLPVGLQETPAGIGRGASGFFEFPMTDSPF